MNKPKISVIVPVYKVEQYLPQCIESILNQTFNDFELLLIDDGSPDLSGEICDVYASKDSRVRVFHKENGGVSSARNIGLDNARGEWITFVDSDDYIDSDLFCDILSLTYLDVDFIQYNTRIYFSDCDFKNQYRLNDEMYYVDKINFFMENLLSPGICGKFIKYDIIHKCNLRFDENLRIGEDTLFMTYVTIEIKYAIILSKAYYHYLYRKNSVMRTINYDNNLDNVICAQNLIAFKGQCNDEYILSNINNRICAYLNSFFDSVSYSHYKDNFSLLKDTLIATSSIYSLLSNKLKFKYYLFVNYPFIFFFIRKLLRIL